MKSNSGLEAKAREIAGEVSAESLMRDTREISRWVRLSGSKEEASAFDYVEGRLKEMGIATERYGSMVYVSLPVSAQLSIGSREVQAITHSMVPATPPGGIDLELVSVGAGQPEAYKGTDVRGRAVLIDGIAIPGKVLTAERAGVSACVFANGDEYVHEMIVSPLWGSPTPQTREQLPSVPVVSVGLKAADDIRAELGEGIARVKIETRVDAGWREVPTLTAQIDGVREPEKFVLFSGHIDSWHYGAMDNGGADAAMLEVARLLKDRPLRRSLRLAFWSGHSHGRYAGSTWYADNFWEDLNDNCVLHLNVDSVGGHGATVVSEGQTMAETRDVGARSVGSVTGEKFNGTRFGRSGDQSFMSLGVPSLFMFVSEQPTGQDSSAGDVVELLSGPGAKGGGVGWWWHTTEDTVDKLDPDFLARDASIYALSAFEFLDTPILPLNIESSATELRQHLEEIQERIGERFDLGGVLDRVRSVKVRTGEVSQRIAAMSEKITESADENGMLFRVNEALLGVDRGLVRLNYSLSDPYGQDLAIGQGPVPLLAAPVDDLLKTEPGCDEEYEIKTLLVRRRNRVQEELRTVLGSLARCLDGLEGLERSVEA